MNTAEPIAPGMDLGFIKNADWSSKQVHDMFPFIHDTVSSLFDAPGSPVGPQLEYLLAWTSHFYNSYGDPNRGPGQVLFLVGRPYVGKSLFVRRILGGLMGGWVQVNDYFTGATCWNVNMLSAHLMELDVVDFNYGFRAMHKVRSRLISVIQGDEVVVNEMYEKPKSLPVYSRLVVTLNHDEESMSILPDSDPRSEGRESRLLLNSGDYLRPFQYKGFNQSDMQEVIQHELPQFARWLEGHEVPEHLRDARFGTKAMRHVDLVK